MPQPNDWRDSVAGPATLRIVDSEAGTVEDVPVSTRPLSPEARSQLPFIGPGDVVAPLEWQRGFSDMQLVSGAELNSYPARANCKVAMRFLDPQGNDVFSSCSGSMQDAGVVLVAAHCLYMRETKSGSPIYRYAEEVWVYPAWDGTDLPLRQSTRSYDFYGAARSTHFVVGSDYVDDGNFNRNVGIIRLDRTETRNVGILTGWYGWVYGTCNESRTYYQYSYPGEACGTPGLHTGVDMYKQSGTIDHCPLTGNQMRNNTDSGCFSAGWGGQSGSSVYYLDGQSRYAAAVTSNSDRSTKIKFCMIWPEMADAIEQFRSQARGNTFDIEALNFRINGSTNLTQGGNVPPSTVLIANTTNANPAPRTVTLHVYLSSNENITTSDTLLGTFNYNNIDFGPMTSGYFPIPQLTVPFGTPAGSYYIGCIIDDSADFNVSNNDTDTWDAQRVQVGACSTPGTVRTATASDGTLCDSVRIDWQAIASAPEYFVLRSPDATFDHAVIVGITDQNFWNDDWASDDGWLYHYWVQGHSGCGFGPETYAGIGWRSPVPTPPTNVVAGSTSCSAVTISWTSSASFFRIYRADEDNSGEALQIGTDTASPYVDFTALPGQTYWYFVKATNSCGGSELSTGDAGTRVTLPPAPINLQATDSTLCDRITLTWDALAGYTQYDIWRGSVNNFGQALKIDVNKNTPYQDITAAPNTTYWYWVTRKGQCGESDPSNANSGRRKTTPGSPPNVDASDASYCDHVQISWASATNATSYRIYRNTVNNSATATHVTSVIGNSYGDYSAPTGTLYYWVRSVGDCGDGALSATTIGSRSGLAAMTGNVNATDGTECNSVVISWTSSTPGAFFEIRRNGISNDPFSATVIGVTGQSPFIDQTAQPGTTYYYWVREVTACGPGVYGSLDTGSAGTSISISQQPLDQTVLEGANAEFSVAAAGATTYQWHFNAMPLTDDGNITGAATAHMSIAGAQLSDEGIYSCRITSTCGDIWSNRAYLTVLPNPFCAADFNQDGGVDGADVSAFFAAWESGGAQADVNQDGGVDGEDVAFFFAAWEAGGC